MNIYWYGQSFFKIESDRTVLAADPFDQSLGLKVPRLAADVVILTDKDNEHNNAKAVKGPEGAEPFLIDSPGEYEVNNIFVQGILIKPESKEKEADKKKDTTIYRIDLEGISLVHLGNLNQILTEEQAEKLEGIDILMIPVGGAYALNAKQAAEMISQLEPRIVIPMQYDIPGLKLKNKLAGLDAFCKEIGVCPKEKTNKFKIAKKDLPQEDLQVAILEP